MSVVDNILVAPIGLAEAYEYIGVAPSNGIYDVYTILSSDRINKWAKCKPIRFNKWAELTDEERRGSSEERLKGIFYGVKLSTGSGQIATLHNVTFDYNSLREGVDIGRLSDLDGYDKNAKPNPMGELPDEINPDIELPVGYCSVAYDQSNTTGVDLSGAINSMSNDDTTTIGDFYPCVLVTYKGRNFVRALWNLRYDLADNYINGTNKNKGFTKYVDNGVWNWQWALIADGLPELADGKEMLVTAFFTRSIVGVNPAPYDWRNWVELTEESTQINSAYAIPEAVAKTIPIKNYYTKGIQIYDGNWRNASGTNIMVSLDWEWVEPKEGVTYKVKYELYSPNNLEQSIGQFERDYPYPPPEGVMQDMMFTVNVGLLNPPSSSTFILDWAVFPSVNQSKACNSGRVTLVGLTIN